MATRKRPSSEVALDFFPTDATKKALASLSSEEGRLHYEVAGETRRLNPHMSVEQEQEQIFNNMYFIDQCSLIASMQTVAELKEVRDAIAAHKATYKPGRILTHEDAMAVFLNVEMVDTRGQVVDNELRVRGEW